MNTFLIQYKHKLSDVSFINKLRFKALFFEYIEDSFYQSQTGSFNTYAYCPLKNEEHIVKVNNYIIVSDSFLINLDEVKEKLGIENTISYSECILHAFLKWGNSCVDHFEGEYSFVIFNIETNAIFGARDQIGIRPLYYYIDEEGVSLSNQLSLLASIVKDKELDRNYLNDILIAYVDNNEYTLFSKIKKLPPAHIFTYYRHQEKIKRYWELKCNNQGTDKTDEKYINDFIQLLKNSLAARTKGNLKIACELSGGIDSSTITVFATSEAKKRGVEIKAFSHTLPDKAKGKIFPFDDEREFVNVVTDHLKLDCSESISNWDNSLLEQTKISDIVQGTIHMQRFHMFSLNLLKQVYSNQIHLLLSGFGGDEAISSGFVNEKRIASLYKSIKLLKISHVKEVWVAMKTIFKQVFPKLFNLIYELFQFKNSKKERYNRFPLLKGTMQKKLKKRFYKKERILTSRRNEKKRLFKINSPYLVHRLEACFHAARYFNIEYSYPLLDKSLLEAFYNLPMHLLINGKYKRYFIRKVIEPYLPPEIVWRNDKSGATIPNVINKIVEDYAELKQFLNECKKLGIGKNVIDIKRMEKWLETFYKNPQSSLHPPVGIFFTYVHMLLFLKQNNITL